MVNTSQIYIVASSLAIGTLLGVFSIWAGGNLRKFLAVCAISFFMLGGGGVLAITPFVIGVLVFTLCIYQAIGLTRLLNERLNPKRLRNTSFFSLVFLAAFQALFLGLWIYDLPTDVKLNRLFIIAALGLGLVWGLISSRLIYIWLRRSRPLTLKHTNISYKKLPTVSLLIPARNEDEDLEQCILSALASDYPKLEIIVLDDCSTDRTPELIKQYAHKGVRFVGGEMPKKNWLAKNQAYDMLASEASGEVLIFTGVDTRLQEHSLTYCVDLFLSKNLKMLCLMPRRGGQKIYGVLIQPMRYWLEFVGSQYFAKRPPVLSTCWMISRQSYMSLGGMGAVKNSILPEAYFAKKLSQDDKYYFARADKNSGITTLKSLSDQVDTAIRVRYPSLKHRLELVWLLSVLYLSVMVLPFIYVVFGWASERPDLWVMALVTTVLLSVPHVILTVYSNPSSWWFSIISFPVVVSYEVILMNISMWRYEFGSVRWKDRNICLPVMEVTTSLPKISEHER